MTTNDVLASPFWPADILPLDTPDMTNQADIFAVVSAVAQVIRTSLFLFHTICICVIVAVWHKHARYARMTYHIVKVLLHALSNIPRILDPSLN